MKQCPRCGYTNKDIANYCARCGYPLYLQPAFPNLYQPTYPPPPPTYHYPQSLPASRARKPDFPIFALILGIGAILTAILLATIR
ncbi:zinc-ribbon domain-containing protein [Stygiolobus azoricus]|uniref:Zinc-ribbon domain-containing protein n=1 Tax=Stygiolobus azoricus TaxID=41675 RepID=A0A650CNH8_9CREN|nr:zinc ribbon domain-containing protein [Stygiolobus azoricus]QGR19245.1 zinc-ribbon domain-containing protein [Stygiolobus azoricus]